MDSTGPYRAVSHLRLEASVISDDVNFALVEQIMSWSISSVAFRSVEMKLAIIQSEGIRLRSELAPKDSFD
jgi:hypothetical protein